MGNAKVDKGVRRNKSQMLTLWGIKALAHGATREAVEAKIAEMHKRTSPEILEFLKEEDRLWEKLG